MRQTLQKALGREQARCLVAPPGSDQEQLTGLQLMKPDLLVTMIRNEPTQFQAAVLACLQNDQAADVIACLPKEQGNIILERIARMERLPHASLKAIIDFMGTFMNEQAGEDYLPVPGEQQVANILNLSDTEARDDYLKNLQEFDASLAERIEDQMLVFEHVTHLSNDGLRVLLSSIEQDELALALKGESSDVKEKIFGTMSKRAAGYLKEEIDILGAVPASKVKAARQGIIRQMDALLEAGEIEMNRGREEMLE